MCNITAKSVGSISHIHSPKQQLRTYAFIINFRILSFVYFKFDCCVCITRCDCTPGYTGPLCQHSLNECESSPCVHGICVDQEDGFRCFCQPGEYTMLFAIFHCFSLRCFTWLCSILGTYGLQCSANSSKVTFDTVEEQVNKRVYIYELLRNKAAAIREANEISLLLSESI